IIISSIQICQHNRYILGKYIYVSDQELSFLLFVGVVNSVYICFSFYTWRHKHSFRKPYIFLLSVFVCFSENDRYIWRVVAATFRNNSLLFFKPKQAFFIFHRYFMELRGDGCITV